MRFGRHRAKHQRLRTEADVTALDTIACALSCPVGTLLGDPTSGIGRLHGGRKIRRRALCFGIGTAAAAAVTAVTVPYARAYAAHTYRLWPGVLIACVLKPAVWVLGTLCILSVLSALKNPVVRERRLRVLLLALGLLLPVPFLCDLF